MHIRLGCSGTFLLSFVPNWCLIFYLKLTKALKKMSFFWREAGINRELHKESYVLAFICYLTSK